jgi:hypothetical protein
VVYTGYVQDGAVVVPEPLPLPDGTPVTVEAAGNAAPAPEQPDVPTVYERYKSFIGSLGDPSLPPDGALNHDHYLYGTPKRSP